MDFLSIDIEGHEDEVLEAFFAQPSVRIAAMAIEAPSVQGYRCLVCCFSSLKKKLKAKPKASSANSFGCVFFGRVRLFCCFKRETRKKAEAILGSPLEKGQTHLGLSRNREPSKRASVCPLVFNPRLHSLILELTRKFVLTCPQKWIGVSLWFPFEALEPEKKQKKKQKSKRESPLEVKEPEKAKRIARLLESQGYELDARSGDDEFWLHSSVQPCRDGQSQKREGGGPVLPKLFSDLHFVLWFMGSRNSLEVEKG